MRAWVRISVKWIAAFVAATSLYWLVSNVDRHGDHIQHALASYYLAARSQAPTPVAPPRREFGGVDGAAGLDVIEMFECMCPAPLGNDIRGWFGLWLVTVLIGGLPIAVLVRASAQPGVRG